MNCGKNLFSVYLDGVRFIKNEEIYNPDSDALLNFFKRNAIHL